MKVPSVFGLLWYLVLVSPVQRYGFPQPLEVLQPRQANVYALYTEVFWDNVGAHNYYHTDNTGGQDIAPYKRSIQDLEEKGLILGPAGVSKTVDVGIELLGRTKEKCSLLRNSADLTALTVPVPVTDEGVLEREGGVGFGSLDGASSSGVSDMGEGLCP